MFKLNRYQIALLLLGAAFVYDEIQLLRGQMFIKSLKTQNTDAGELLKILAKKIEEHPEIEFDEFEQVVMGDIFARNDSK